VHAKLLSELESRTFQFVNPESQQALGRFRAKHALGLDPWVDTGSREENASKQESGALVLILSEAKLQGGKGASTETSSTAGE
jgi:hypothetical protein